MIKVHSFLLPHEENNHRAKAIHPKFLVFYLLLFLFIEFFGSFISIVGPSVLGYATNIKVDSLLEYTNKKREQNNVPPLVFDPVLSNAAREKGEDMIAKGYWAHNSPDGTSPWYWIRKNGYSYLYAGENLARDFNDSDAVVEAWMASPTHKDNILNPKYKDIGLAVVNGKFQGYETTLVVQMFGTKQESVAKIVGQGANVEKQFIPVPTQEVKIAVAPLAQEPPQAVAGLPQPVLLANTERTQIKRPTIDIFSLTKNLGLVISLFLLFTVLLDSIVVHRKKIVRLTGHNLAHTGMLLFMIFVLLLTVQGKIL